MAKGLLIDLGAIVSEAVRSTRDLSDDERKRQRSFASSRAEADRKIPSVSSAVGEADEDSQGSDSDSADGKSDGDNMPNGIFDAGDASALGVEKMEPEIPTSDDLESVDIDDVIKKLNFLRSGLSLSDADVKSELTSYFGRMSPGEREALLVFSSGLSQIIAGDVPGDKAPSPTDAGIKTAGVGSAVEKDASPPEAASSLDKIDGAKKRAPTEKAVSSAEKSNVPPTGKRQTNRTSSTKEVPISVGESLQDKSAVLESLARNCYRETHAK